MIGSVITLNQYERQLVKGVAKVRYQSNREQGVVESPRGPNRGISNDVEGLGAELAFCKLFGAYPSCLFDMTPRSSKKGEDEDGDVVFMGRSIDVKSTPYKNGRLITPNWKKASMEAYCLMVGKFPSFEFRGFILGTDFIKECNIKNLGYGPTYVVEQSALVEWDDLQW